MNEAEMFKLRMDVYDFIKWLIKPNADINNIYDMIYDMLDLDEDIKGNELLSQKIYVMLNRVYCCSSYEGVTSCDDEVTQRMANLLSALIDKHYPEGKGE